MMLPLETSQILHALHQGLGFCHRSLNQCLPHFLHLYSDTSPTRCSCQKLERQPDFTTPLPAHSHLLFPWTLLSNPFSSLHRRRPLGHPSFTWILQLPYLVTPRLCWPPFQLVHCSDTGQNATDNNHAHIISAKLDEFA